MSAIRLALKKAVEPPCQEYKDLRELFPLDKKIEFHFENEDISAEGIRVIQKRCKEELGVVYGSIVGNAWAARTKYGDGNFPARVEKWYAAHSIRVPPTLKKWIGDTARQHFVKSDTYWFDFTATFNWEGGDFGDDGACFMGSERNKLDILKMYDGRAVRFYNEKGRGIARAWMLFPDRYDVFNGKGSDEKYVGHVVSLVNAYNSSGGLTLTRIAEIVSRWSGLAKVQIDVEHIKHGYFYANGYTSWDYSRERSESERQQWALGYPEHLDGLKHILFNWDGNKPVQCSQCNTMTKTYSLHNHEVWCQQCVDEKLFLCSSCLHNFPVEDMFQAGEYKVCPKCKPNLLACAICAEWLLIRNSYSVRVGRKMGRICKKHQTAHCFHCGGVYALEVPCQHHEKKSEVQLQAALGVEKGLKEWYDQEIKENKVAWKPRYRLEPAAGYRPVEPLRPEPPPDQAGAGNE